jgi:DNA-nicking Smr family endonuclease
MWPSVRRRPFPPINCRSTSEAFRLMTLDLHPIFRDQRAIDRAVREAVFKAAATGVDVLEIITGKGSGTLKRRILACLAQRHLSRLYQRVEEDAANGGRILVHFK